MYKRIVLKLSGEVLAGPRGFGLDADKVAEITGEIVECTRWAWRSAWWWAEATSSAA
jgi:uridylate kinase